MFNFIEKYINKVKIKMVKKYIYSIVRTACAAIFGYLAGKGLISQDDAATFISQSTDLIIGILGVLIVQLFSLKDKIDR